MNEQNDHKNKILLTVTQNNALISSEQLVVFSEDQVIYL